MTHIENPHGGVNRKRGARQLCDAAGRPIQSPRKRAARARPAARKTASPPGSDDKKNEPHVVAPPRNDPPPTALRKQLRANGYDSVPACGKDIYIGEWQKKFFGADDTEVESWTRKHPDHTNTGILAKFTPTFDVDLLNPEAAEAVEKRVRERYAQHGRVMTRIGQHPKRAFPFKTSQPFKKITRNLVAPDGKTTKLEFLADGQMFVAAGIHPKTRLAYTWPDGSPLDVRRDELPSIDGNGAQTLMDDVVEMLCRDHGYRREEPKAKPDGHDSSGADWSSLINNILKGHALHDSLRDLAMSKIKAGMSAGAVVNELRALMNASRARVDDAERWQKRYDDIRRAVSTAEEKLEEQQQAKRPRLAPIDCSNWDNEPVPDQEWAIQDRVPLEQTCLFSGEGGSGKSLMMLQASAAMVLGREWLGIPLSKRPAMFYDAEDTAKVIHRRCAPIVEYYDTKFTDLIAGGIEMFSLAGQDSVLATFNRSGRIEPTALYRDIMERARDIQPGLITLASSANFFAGSEIDRSHVQQFISLLTAMAAAANGAVVLISHPSLSGINSGSGTSGSTGWHNSARSRMYLQGAKKQEGEPLDTESRELSFKKNNYGPISESIIVRYESGLFVPVGGTTIDQAEYEERAEAVFLDLLRRFSRENRTVSEKHGPNYAPARFVGEQEATAAGVTAKALAGALSRLFFKKRIGVEEHGPPSKRRTRLVVKA